MVAPIFLYSGYVPAANTVLVTTPVNATYVIRQATFANVAGAARTLTVYAVPAGGTPAASNQVIAGLTIGSNETYVAVGLLNMSMPVGMTLVASASVASSIAATISGLSA